MLASTPLAISYGIFALIATVANIGAQDVLVRLYSGPGHIAASMVLGTGVGLVVKYVLDKRYIFRFKANSVAHDTQTFALYTLMGLLTTAVFWGFEWGFHLAFETKAMRYLGGVIGLAIGYLIKYHLDKRYVFKSEPV
jgi:peptidoglycan biosynthesis protein MviN/MurJ (putative lipid II flippase)